MRLSRSQVAFVFTLLLASFIGGDAIAQRYSSYYTQQQIYRQNQAQQIQMQRQQEQMRRQQEQARQQQAAMRRQQLEQQRIMQQRRDQAIRQRQIAMEHQRKVTEQRQQAQSKKIAQGTILSNQKATHQNLLKHRSLEKHRQERLLRLKQELFQTQKTEKKKTDKRDVVRLFSLTEKFNVATGGRGIYTYQPNKAHTTKELVTQRQTSQRAAKKLNLHLRKTSLFNGMGSEPPSKESLTQRNTAKSSGGCDKNICKGGLNLFKFGAASTSKSSDWKEGSFMLFLPNKSTPKDNWRQNSSRLREQMSKGALIYDSYRDPITGNQIPTGGFLRAERRLLESRGWQYNASTGAYHPPQGNRKN